MLHSSTIMCNKREGAYSINECFNTIRKVSQSMKFNTLVPELSVKDIEKVEVVLYRDTWIPIRI